MLAEDEGDFASVDEPAPAAQIVEQPVATARAPVNRPAGRSRVASSQPASPAAPSANNTVTLRVSGANDKETLADFSQKLGELARAARGGSGGRQSMLTRNGQTQCVAVTGIDNVQEFADGITFAEVTNVSGQTIDVKLSPLPASERPPVGSDFVAQVLFDLKATAVNRRKDALRRLRDAPPDEARREEVSKAIEPLLRDPDVFARSDAAKALAVWGGTESTDALIEAVKDPNFGVVWAVLDTLKAIHDPAAAKPVAAMLTEGRTRGKAADALRAMGPDAQKAVIPYLNNPELSVRVEACRILGVIGTTEETRLALQALYRKVNGQGGDARAADDAIKRIGLPKAKKKK